MPVEAGVNGIEDLNAAWPTGTDPKSEGDDHIRNVKLAVQGSWPSMAGPNWIDGQLKVHGLDMNLYQVTNMSDGSADDHAATVRQLNAALSAELPQWGRVGLDGNSGATPGSGGWSSARIGLGHYRLTFTKAASSTENQSVVCTVGQQDQAKHNRSITTFCVSSTIVDVFVYNTVLADKVDDDFAFQRMA